MKIKRFVSALIMAVMVLAMVPAFPAVTASAAGEDITIYVNGNILYTNDELGRPMIVEGRTLLPLRVICEALGCDVDWNDSKKQATIDNDLTRVNVKVGDYWVKMKDRRLPDSTTKSIPIDVPARIVNGRTMVPARALAEALNAQVIWYNDSREITIRMEYNSIAPYHNGLATVTKRIPKAGGGYDVKYGFIDKNGKEVIPPIYASAENFYFSRAAVSLDGENFGYIDKTGRMVIPAIYDMAYNFETTDDNNPSKDTVRAIVVQNGEKQLIDIDGRWVEY